MNYINLSTHKFVGRNNQQLTKKISLDFEVTNIFEVQFINSKNQILDIDSSNLYLAAAIVPEYSNSKLIFYSTSYTYNSETKVLTFVIDSFTENYMKFIKKPNQMAFLKIGKNAREDIFGFDTVVCQPRIYTSNTPSPEHLDEYYTMEEADEKFATISGFNELSGIVSGDIKNLANNYWTKQQVAEQIANIERLTIVVVEELPPVEEGYDFTIYLVPDAEGSADNNYLEYLRINGHWELIGSTAIDLSQYYTKDDVNANFFPVTGGIVSGDVTCNALNVSGNIVANGSLSTSGVTINGIDINSKFLPISGSVGDIDIDATKITIKRNDRIVISSVNASGIDGEGVVIGHQGGSNTIQGTQTTLRCGAEAFSFDANVAKIRNVNSGITRASLDTSGNLSILGNLTASGAIFDEKVTTKKTLEIWGDIKSNTNAYPTPYISIDGHQSTINRPTYGGLFIGRQQSISPGETAIAIGRGHTLNASSQYKDYANAIFGQYGTITGDTIFAIGNGVVGGEKSNAFAVSVSGDITVPGIVNAGLISTSGISVNGVDIDSKYFPLSGGTINGNVNISGNLFAGGLSASGVTINGEQCATTDYVSSNISNSISSHNNSLAAHTDGFNHNLIINTSTTPSLILRHAQSDTTVPDFHIHSGGEYTFFLMAPKGTTTWLNTDGFRISTSTGYVYARNATFPTPTITSPTISGQAISINNNVALSRDYDITETPSSNADDYYFIVKDTNGKNVGRIMTSRNADGSIVMRFGLFNNLRNSNNFVSIGAGVDVNGNAVTSAPTPTAGDNSTKIATTAFVQKAIADALAAKGL